MNRQAIDLGKSYRQVKRSNSNYQRLKSQQGFSTVVPLLLCIIAIVFYMEGGKNIVENYLDPFYHLLAVVTMAVVVICTIGCSFHLLLRGDRSESLLQNKIDQQTKRLLEFVPEVEQQLSDLERIAWRYGATFRPSGKNSMELARRVLRAIERRAVEVNELTSSNSHLKVIEAYEHLHSDLKIGENCVNDLIASDPVRPLPCDQWLSTVDTLLEQVTTEIEQTVR